MSRSVKIKQRTVKSTINDKDVISMFNSATGADGEGGSCNLRIAFPKYRSIRTHVGRFIRVLEMFLGSSPLKLFPAESAQLATYIASLKASYARDFCIESIFATTAATSASATTAATAAALALAKAEDDPYENVPADEVARFAQVYADIKKCNTVNIIIVTCRNLVDYKKFIGDPKNLSARFLTKKAGSTLCPLPDLNLNFRQMYINDRLTDTDREIVLVTLHKLHSIGQETFDVLQQPDIDVDEFVNVVRMSMSDIRKHIPRCDAAFDKILDSVHLLKNNFGRYHGDFVASGNQTIIMENFVLDVSQQEGTKSSPQLVAQFRTIIKKYREMAKNNVTDPRLRAIFSRADENFAVLERKNREGADDDSDDNGAAVASDSDSDSDSDAAAVLPQAAGQSLLGETAPVDGAATRSDGATTLTDGDH